MQGLFLMKDIVSSGLLAFTFIFGGAIFGFLLGKIAPAEYRASATERIVQNAMSIISLLSALVLGLLVASAKNKFDASNFQMVHFSASLMALNNDLLDYGPDSQGIRLMVQRFVTKEIEDTWHLDVPAADHDDITSLQLLASIQNNLRGISTETDEQRLAVKDALEIVGEFLNAKWNREALELDRVPQPFLWVLTGWISVLFFSNGFFAPRNPAVLVALLVTAVSLSGAIAMIIDLDTPFEGAIVVSPEPMQKALAKISVPFSWQH